MAVRFFTTNLAALLLCCGCANQFTKFYQDNTPRLGPSAAYMRNYSGSTVVRSMANGADDIKAMKRKNYVALGSSAFQGSRAPGRNDLVNQAKRVGADVVLYRSDYLGSSQTAVPFVNYNQGQTYTTTSSGTVQANTPTQSGHRHSDTKRIADAPQPHGNRMANAMRNRPLHGKNAFVTLDVSQARDMQRPA